MGRPFFSVVIPFHNAGKYLEEAVCSVRGQTFSDWELILVDDGSKDDGPKKAAEAALDDVRIHLISDGVRRGAAMARNFGMDKAAGTYLIFLDADDVMEKDLMEGVHESLVRHPAKIVVWGLVEERIRRGRLKSRKVIRPIKTNFSEKDEDRELLKERIMQLEIQTLFGYLWNKAYSLEYLKSDDIRIPDQPFNEDVMMNIEAFDSLPAVNILSAAYSRYRLRESGSLTHRYLPDYYRIAMMRVDAILCQQMRFGHDTAPVRRKIASIWVRYVTSAIERTYAPQAGMSHKGRADFVRGVIKSPLAKKLLPYAKPEDRIFAMTARALRKHDINTCLLIGYAIHAIKQRPFGAFDVLPHTWRRGWE